METRTYRLLKTALIIPLLVTAISLSTNFYRMVDHLSSGVLLSTNTQVVEALFFDILNLIVYYGLYRNRKWSFYPGILLLMSSSILVLLQPALDVVIKIVVISVNMLYMYLIYTNRSAFSK